ncbi:MAG: carboxypeptidase regulatory-like domain-containing protein [Bacteroidetes bacterium]|jgi:hypothetical protein|nr:carboxypeptidase regulatory-like domain-containing protein [Bacteroidota bacterium]
MTASATKAPPSYVLAALLGLLWMGCLGEAPHDNPLDPESDAFQNEGGVMGTVTDRAEAGLPDVDVRLTPATPPASGPTTFVTRTDAQGRYSFRDAPADLRYRLEAHRDGYAPVIVDSVEVEPGRTATMPALRLNALPVVSDLTLRTVHLSRWWPNDLYFFEATATVADADGIVDVDSVWLSIPDLGFQVLLDPESGDQYTQRVAEDALPVSSLTALLGTPLRLGAVDRQGGSTVTPPQQFVRVIEEVPIAVQPSGDVAASTNPPTLTWEPTDLGFPFTYRVEVFRDEVNQAIQVLQVDGLSSTQTELTLSDPLPTGPYYWTVSVFDAFGNQSRSKEAAFRIP